MKSIQIILIAFVVLVSGIVLSACSSSKRTTEYRSGALTDYNKDASKNSKDNIVIFESNISLIDHLRRIPGLHINRRGGETLIMVRGMQSIYGNNSALFVVNGRPIGTSFNQLESTVDVTDIRRISVLRGSEASQRYGLQASAGAILITTK
ncbi:MAG: TonB-dependent receptor plug domain-containing protein [Balneolaceae bacterium]